MSTADAEQKYLSTVSRVYNRLSLQGLPEHKAGLHTVSLEQVFIKLTLQIEQIQRFVREDLKDERRFAREDSEDKRRVAAPQVEKKSLSIADALHQHRRLVVLGAPGGGKTTLVRWLAVTFANQQQAQADRLGERFIQNRLPVVLELRHFAHRLSELTKSPSTFKLVEEIAKFVDKDANFPDTDAAFMQNAFKEGQCLLLCDGLDEIADFTARQRFLEALSAFAIHYPDNWCILTSRPHGFSYIADFQKTEIQPFSDEDLAQFIQYWYRSVSDPVSAQAETKALLAQIQERQNIRELARNPLLATIMAILYRSKRVLPHRRVELYAQCCEVLLGTWEQNKAIQEQESGVIGQFDWKTKLHLLLPVAYELHQETERLAAPEAKIEERLTKGLEGLQKRGVDMGGKPLDQIAREFILAIRDRSGLLQGRGDGTLEFMHRTFQEYLCACYIADVLSPEACLDEVMTHLHESWWQEVHLLVVGHLGKDRHGAERAEQLLLAVLHVYKMPWRWLLPQTTPSSSLSRRGTRGFFLPALLRRGWGWLNQNWFSRWQWQRRIAWLLAREFELAAQMFADRAPEGRTPAMTEALLKVALGYFVEYLNGLSIDVSFLVATVVKCSSTQVKQEVAKYLVQALLQDKDDSVRWSAAYSLGELEQADDTVISVLVQALLQDKGNFVRGSAAKSLGQLGQANDTVISALVQALLQDKDYLVRGRAAESLGQLGQADDTVISALVQALLQDKDDWVPGSAAYSLGQSLLQDKDDWVRGSAAYSLGQLGQADDTVISALVQALLQDEDDSVRRKAAESLGQLGQANDTVISALMQALLQDEDFRVRQSAAYSLGELEQADDTVISLPQALLQDKDNSVQGSAAKSLGRLGQANDTVISALRQTLLQDENKWRRISAAERLGQLGQADDTVISALVQALLQDECFGVRRSAAESLGQLGQANDTVISALVQALLQDKDNSVRWRTAESLGQLGQADDTVISALVQALLQDEYDSVRERAAESLGQLGQADDTVISALVQALLQDKDNSVRQSAADSLGQLGQADDTVISALMQALLQDKDNSVRQSAADSLGQLKISLGQLKIKDTTQLTKVLLVLNRALFSNEKRKAVDTLRNLLDGRQIPGYRWRSREKRRQFWHRLKRLSSKRIMLVICISIPLPFLPEPIIQVLGIIGIAFTILPPLLFPPSDDNK